MGKYLQGAAFYLFSYFILGLVNSGIMYFMTKILKVMPSITLAFLIFLTIFVLFFSFKKSLDLFILKGDLEIPQWRLILGWLLHFILFVSIASAVEIGLLPLVGNLKLIKVITVFSNLILFFFLYWLVVKVLIERGRIEA